MERVGLWLGLALVGAAVAEVLKEPIFGDLTEKSGLAGLVGKKYYGITIFDGDRDGQWDLLLSDHSDRAPEWYWGVGNKKFKFAENLGIGTGDFHGTAVADLTESSRLSAIVSRGGRNGSQPTQMLLVEYDENKAFNITEGEGLNLGQDGMRGRSARAFDIDHDGDLDVVYINRAIDGQRIVHRVYENLGGGEFTYRADVGFEEVQAWWVALLDYNDDGYLDLLFMGEAFELWRGMPGFKYEKDSNAIPSDIVTNFVNGAVEFDFNGDGLLDLYLCRGHRHGKHEHDDILLLNKGGYYEDISEEAGVQLGDTTVHATDGDFNNDGYTDLYLSRTGFEMREVPDLILMNVEGKYFESFSSFGVGGVRSGERGNVAHTFDADFDGRVDIIAGFTDGPWRFYRNKFWKGYKNRWLLVRVGHATKTSKHGKNVSALGAKVTVVCGSMRWEQRIGSRGESHSQSYLDTLHFGLGKFCENDIVDIVKVFYIGGKLMKAENQRVNSMVEIGRYRW